MHTVHWVLNGYESIRPDMLEAGRDALQELQQGALQALCQALLLSGEG
jgi:hypothetical protein